MEMKRIFKRAAISMVGIVGLGVLQGFGSSAYAADVVEDAPPSTVNITVHKLMYDKDTQLNIDVNGIKNDGHTHDQLPEGVSKFSKADYGDVEFTIANITDIVLPKKDSELTNAKVDEIIADLDAKGVESDYIKTGKNVTTSAIDDNGEVTFANLPGYVNDNQNVYVIVESKSAAGLVKQKAKSMLVAAPMTDTTGKAFLKNIQLYPKNITEKQKFTFTKLADDGTEKGEKTALEKAKFEVYKGNPGEGKKLNAAITNNEGKIVIEDLTVGKYYLVELVSDKVVGADKLPSEDQYLLGADARNDKNNKLTFEIGMDGVSTELKGSYVNYKAPTIEKTVTNGVGSEKSFQVGQAVNYVGKVVIPNDIKGGIDGIEINGVKQATSYYSSFRWEDTAGAGLTYVPEKADLKVTNKDGSVELKEGTDYTLANKENGFVVDFILEDGKVSEEVAKLKGQQVLLAYNMIVNETAVVGDPLSNDVSFIFNNNPHDPKEEREIPTEAIVKTYGAKFLKVDSGWFGLGNKTPLEGAEFVAMNSEGAFYGGQIDKDNDGVKEAVWVKEISEAEVLKSDKDGKFEIQGLAEGDYKLRETKAPEGYQKLMEDVDFKVNKDSFKEENRVTIKNKQKPALAQTGGNRLLIIGAVSVAVIAAGGGLLIYRKRQSA